MDSDIDVVVLTDDPSPYVIGEEWVAGAVSQNAPVVRTVQWGDVLIERRVRLRSGLHVEFGFAPVAWATTDPVDPGTAEVVRKGCLAVFDPELIIQHLTEALAPG
jgi:hypothetical protein